MLPATAALRLSVAGRWRIRIARSQRGSQSRTPRRSLPIARTAFAGIPAAPISSPSVSVAITGRPAAAGRPVIATDTEGEEIGAAGIPANAVLAIGDERRGVRDWLPRWDRAIRIRQRPATESLNAAVAGSIVLYEAMRCQDPCQVAEKP